MGQLSYSKEFADPQVGMKGDLGVIDVVTGLSPDPGILFGQFVVRDSGNVLKYPAASGDITSPSTLAGVAMSTFTVESHRDALGAHYNAYDAVNVLRKGAVWVQFEDTPALDSIVYVRYTANGTGKVVGNFLTTGDSGKAAILPACKVKKLGTAGRAMIELNLPA